MKHWNCTKPKMPVLFISGADDPCMGNVRHFAKAVRAMRQAGYQDVRGKLYPGMRHEILNEADRKRVYRDIFIYIHKKSFEGFETGCYNNKRVLLQTSVRGRDY